MGREQSFKSRLHNQKQLNSFFSFQKSFQNKREFTTPKVQPKSIYSVHVCGLIVLTVNVGFLKLLATAGIVLSKVLGWIFFFFDHCCIILLDAQEKRCPLAMCLRLQQSNLQHWYLVVSHLCILISYTGHVSFYLAPPFRAKVGVVCYENWQKIPHCEYIATFPLYWSKDTVGFPFRA